MSNVAGFDMSLTGTGAIVLNEKAEVLLRHTIKTQPSEPMRQRLVKIADVIVQIVTTYSAVGVVKEAPAFSAAHAVHAIGTVHGAVDYAMEKAAQPTAIAVSPSTLKKYATGRGIGEKSDVKMWVSSNWGEKFSDNNQCDAYVLARIAGNIAGIIPTTRRHEDECLKTILNGAGLDAQAKAIKLNKKDARVCACGKKMKTGIEMESGRCGECIRNKPTTEGGAAQ